MTYFFRKASTSFGPCILPKLQSCWHLSAFWFQLVKRFPQVNKCLEIRVNSLTSSNNRSCVQSWIHIASILCPTFSHPKTPAICLRWHAEVNDGWMCRPMFLPDSPSWLVSIKHFPFRTGRLFGMVWVHIFTRKLSGQGFQQKSLTNSYWYDLVRIRKIRNPFDLKGNATMNRYKYKILI